MSHQVAKYIVLLLQLLIVCAVYRSNFPDVQQPGENLARGLYYKAAWQISM